MGPSGGRSHHGKAKKNFGALGVRLGSSIWSDPVGLLLTLPDGKEEMHKCGTLRTKVSWNASDVWPQEAYSNLDPALIG